LRSLGKTLEDLRSDKTIVHGKTDGDYIVDNPLWAEFVINTAATLGLFLWRYYENKYKPAKKSEGTESINSDEIPF
jgi:hypothetical protein